MLARSNENRSEVSMIRAIVSEAEIAEHRTDFVERYTPATGPRF
jgi:hypothetical protein